MVTPFLRISPYSWYCRKLQERDGTEFHSWNAPLGLQEYQKGILPKRNGTEWNAGIPQNGGSRIAGTKKGMHNLVLCAGDRISRIHPLQRWN
jgi:hypothetical protein